MNLNPNNILNESNIGTTVKKVATIVLVLCLIITVVLSFSFGDTFSRYGGQIDGGVLLLTLLGGSAVSGLLWLVMYAFGSLVESSIISTNMNAATLNRLNKLIELVENKD